MLGVMAFEKTAKTGQRIMFLETNTGISES